MSALSPTEIITRSFYAWETRGRGWELAAYPVALEPPFRRCFVLPDLAAEPGIIDDGKRPTFISALIEGVKGAIRPPPRVTEAPEPFEEPAPYRIGERDALVTFRLLVPEDYAAEPETMVRLLSAWRTAYKPIALELVGGNHGVQMQIVCAAIDAEHVAGQVGALAPEASLVEDEDLCAKEWDTGAAQVAVDFGLSHEFFLPLALPSARSLDLYASLIPALSRAGADELIVVQVLFEGVRNPWVEATREALSDGRGGSVFADAPEFPKLAAEKLRTPLVAVSLRVFAQAASEPRAWDLVRGTEAFFLQFARSGGNELIPLDNDGYGDGEHTAAIFLRESYRTGMLLSVEELAGFAHFPDRSIRHPALLRSRRRTKAAPESASRHACVLGENVHRGKRTLATVSNEERLQHTWIIGASGSGKSHLILQLILQDLEAGNGIAVLDPHGDLIEDVLRRVPKERANDVVLFDPADSEYPIGFNVLAARSELEKTLIASDLVGVFRRLSTSWGDTMGTVLGNAVLAILESSRGGTLLDLRRFLVEERFRKAYLSSIEDEEVRFFWMKEYPLIGARSIGPILTRLDTFLRPKVIRNIVGQTAGSLDLGAVIDGRQIFLGKLAQGMIGEENSFLLGSLLLGKFQQLALARQQLSKDERRPFFLYADEFQQFVTPSLETLLTGARKYGLGLTLAHQTLAQLGSVPKIESALFGNASTRVVFRVGEQDARRLAEGFSFFEAEDVAGLARGEALVRLGSASRDFNLKTLPLPKVPPDAEERRSQIISRSQVRYGTPIETLRALLKTRYGPADEPAEVKPSRPIEEAPVAPSEGVAPKTVVDDISLTNAPEPKPIEPSKTRRTPIDATPATPGRGGQEHKYLQQLVKRLAEERGFRASIEEPAGDGRADVVLRKADLSIAVEISITTDPDHEAENLRKCQAAGFERILFVVPDKKRREKLAARFQEEACRVFVIAPEHLVATLDEFDPGPAPQESTVRGYKVKVTRQTVSPEDAANRRSAVAAVIAKTLQKGKQDR